jgi:hypothetical protein
MANTILNAASYPISTVSGTLPNMMDGMADWFQPMIFEPTIKNETGYQVVENALPIVFRGVIMPFKDRELWIKPEGERAWTWLHLFSDPQLELLVDQVVIYLGVQTRVMALKNYAIYGFMEYQLVQDWLGSGPNPSPFNYGRVGGGNAQQTYFNQVISGGEADTTVFNGVISGGKADNV